jgi:putative ABC transport system permease protein
VAGTITGTPALPGTAGFIVMPLAALRGGTGQLPASEMLVAGPHLDAGRLAAVVRRVVPGGVVTLRSDFLARLARAPLQRGTGALFAAAVAAAAAFSVVILLLMVALGARGRELALARLAAMGVTAGQARLVALLETLPGVLAAAVAGAACAAVLAPLTGPVLDLSVFTGSTAAVPVRAGFAAVALPALGLALLGAASLAAEVTVGRRGLAATLREAR